MAKITVDAGTCVGCGLCEQVAPEVFKIVDGIAQVKKEDIAAAKDAADQCPVSAIKVG